VQFRKFVVNIESSWERVARGPQKRGTLGHGLFGLCVNPSLATGVKSFGIKNWKVWSVVL